MPFFFFFLLNNGNAPKAWKPLELGSKTDKLACVIYLYVELTFCGYMLFSSTLHVFSLRLT